MVDREDDIEKLPARVLAARFVTVVGAGGIGKTTLAVAAGHRLASSFAGAVLFVDLSMVNDPALVGTILASLLGLSVQSEDATPGIVAHLKDKSLLLILDTCEHLAAAVARLASAIFFCCAEYPHSRNQPRGAADRGRNGLPAGSTALPTRGTVC